MICMHDYCVERGFPEMQKYNIVIPMFLCHEKISLHFILQEVFLASQGNITLQAN